MWHWGAKKRENAELEAELGEFVRRKFDHLANDPVAPQRAVLAEILEQILVGQGYALAPLNNKGFPTGSGVWLGPEMAGGSVGVMFNDHLADESINDQNTAIHRQLYQLIVAAFEPVLGRDTRTYVLDIAIEAEVVVKFPPDEQLSVLHQRYCR